MAKRKIFSWNTFKVVCDPEAHGIKLNSAKSKRKGKGKGGGC